MLQLNEIEKQFAERLRYYSKFRRTFVTFLQSRIPFISLVENNIAFHSILIFATILVFIGIFEIIRTLTLFSFHPIFMTLGTFIFVGEGIASYRNHSLLEAFSPIMQHNKKVKVRAIHQSAMTIGATFILLGLLIILSEKFEYKKNIIPHTFHSIFATVALSIVAIQVIIGQQRVEQTTYNPNYKRWHNDLGFLLWDLLCFCVFTGLASFLEFGFFNFLILWVPWIVWLTVVLQMYSRANRREDVDRSLDDYENANKISSNFSNSNLASLEGGNGNNNGDNDNGANEAENADENSTFITTRKDEEF